MRKSWKSSSSSLRMIRAPRAASSSRALDRLEAWPAGIAGDEVVALKRVGEPRCSASRRAPRRWRLVTTALRSSRFGHGCGRYSSVRRASSGGRVARCTLIPLVRSARFARSPQPTCQRACPTGQLRARWLRTVRGPVREHSRHPAPVLREEAMADRVDAAVHWAEPLELQSVRRSHPRSTPSSNSCARLTAPCWRFRKRPDRPIRPTRSSFAVACQRSSAMEWGFAPVGGGGAAG